MQKLLVAMFLVFTLAGCLSDEAPTERGGGGDGSEEAAVADRIGVVLHTGTYDASPGMPAVFEVEVPEGAVDVRYEISTAAVPGTISSELALAGCGSSTFSTGSNVMVGVMVSWDGDLCDAAEPGVRSLSVTAATVPMTGTLTLRADVPS